MRLITVVAALILSGGLVWAQSNESTQPSTSSASGTLQSAGQATGAASAAEMTAPASASSDATSSSASSNAEPGPTAEPSATERFAAADLAGKLQIINDASAQPSAKSGPLFQAAIDYLVANLPVLREDKLGQTMAEKAAQLLGQLDYRPSVESVWKLFQFSTTKTVRLTALDTLAIVAKGSSVIINQMNQWLVGRNLLHLSDSSVDPQLIDGCVRALAALADPSSFQVLFATMEAGYGEQVTNDARNGLKLVGGDLGLQLLRVVSSARYPTRLAALEMTMSSGGLTAGQKGKIASAALQSALSPNSSSVATQESIRTLRYAAVKALGQLEWSPAQSLVLENFNLVAGQFASGNATADELIASADALADMTTHEAAVRLSLYLGLINSQIGKGGSFDQSVTRTVVEDLERLGDKVAYDSLYAMQFLNYPEALKQLAERALQGLSAQ